MERMRGDKKERNRVEGHTTGGRKTRKGKGVKTGFFCKKQKQKKQNTLSVFHKNTDDWALIKMHFMSNNINKHQCCPLMLPCSSRDGPFQSLEAWTRFQAE